MAFKYNNTTVRNNTSNAQQEREPSEFDGIYINIGVEHVDSHGDVQFARLNHRAIALADMQPTKVTQRARKNNPDWAARTDKTNAILAMLRKGGLELEEGDGRPLKLQLELFRAETTDNDDTPDTDVSDITMDALFGDE